MADETHVHPGDGSAGGWGSVKSLGSILRREHVVIEGAGVLIHQNKADGYSCVSCAWGKPAKPHPFEFCENGAKATAWELTARRATPEFFLRHTVQELETWSDHDLEEQGRLTAPMRWDRRTDRYLETTWEEAFGRLPQSCGRKRPRASSSTPPDAPRSKPPTCISCSHACTAATIFRAAPTCATRAPRSPCPRRSASQWAP